MQPGLRQTLYGPALVAMSLLGGLLGCNTPGSSADARLSNAGSNPGSVPSPGEDLGGLIEVARVTFPGSELTTELVGDNNPFRADGLELVAGGATFAYPRSSYVLGAYTVLPEGPAIAPEQAIQCVTELGPARSLAAAPGVPVDGGPFLTIEGYNADGIQTLEMPLLRSPARVNNVSVSSIVYRLIDRARIPGAYSSVGNWSAGNAIKVRLAGGAAPSGRDHGSLPFSLLSEQGIQLPRALEGLSINNQSLSLPARDPLTGAVMERAPRFSLPNAETPLVIGWSRWSTQQKMVLAVEYFGPGPGRCPADCGQGSECCATDDDCESSERCEAPDGQGKLSCYPRDGAAEERLGAVICTVPDTGTALLTADQLVTLNAGVDPQRVRGAVLRVGRSVSGSIRLGDALTSDGTRQPLEPIWLRASDVAVIRLNAPAL
jgi:hypothetical protein